MIHPLESIKPKYRNQKDTQSIDQKLKPLSGHEKVSNEFSKEKYESISLASKPISGVSIDYSMRNNNLNTENDSTVSSNMEENALNSCNKELIEYWPSTSNASSPSVTLKDEQDKSDHFIFEIATKKEINHGTSFFIHHHADTHRKVNTAKLHYEI